MRTIFVVDAGVLFTKWVDQNPEAEFVTTDEIMSEIINRPSRQRIEFLLSTGQLRVESYDSGLLSTIREASATTGDRRVLSDVDISLLALALTRHRNGLSAVIVSMDFALLNTALALDLEILDPSGHFKHKILWRYKCPSCGHSQQRPPPDLLCPVCGTLMRRNATRNKRVR